MTRTDRKPGLISRVINSRVTCLVIGVAAGFTADRVTPSPTSISVSPVEYHYYNPKYMDRSDCDGKVDVGLGGYADPSAIVPFDENGDGRRVLCVRMLNLHR